MHLSNQFLLSVRNEIWSLRYLRSKQLRSTIYPTRAASSWQPGRHMYHRYAATFLVSFIYVLRWWPNFVHQLWTVAQFLSRLLCLSNSFRALPHHGNELNPWAVSEGQPWCKPYALIVRSLTIHASKYEKQKAKSNDLEIQAHTHVYWNYRFSLKNATPTYSSHRVAADIMQKTKGILLSRSGSFSQDQNPKTDVSCRKPYRDRSSPSI